MATINFTDNGDSTISYSGGEATVAIYGTFGGGTLKAEASFDNGTTWIEIKSVNNVAITGVNANVIHNIKITGAGCKIKFTVAGATSPNLKVTI